MGRAPFVERTGGKDDPWVKVSINWPRIENVFKRAALNVSKGAREARSAAGAVPRAAAAGVAAELDSLKAWMDSVWNYLKRIFSAVRRFFGPGELAEAGAKVAGERGAEPTMAGTRESEDLSADLPKEEADKLTASLDAYLASVVPVHQIDATRLPADLPSASVAALAAAQADVALDHYLKMSSVIDQIDDQLAMRIKASPISEHFAKTSTADTAAALLRLHREDPDNAILKMIDPKGEIALLADRAASVQRLCTNYLEASAFDLYVAARAGMTEQQIEGMLQRHGMNGFMFTEQLKMAGLGEACEAFIRRRDANFDLNRGAAQAGPQQSTAAPGQGAAPAGATGTAPMTAASVATAAPGTTNTAAPATPRTSGAASAAPAASAPPRNGSPADSAAASTVVNDVSHLARYGVTGESVGKDTAQDKPKAPNPFAGLSKFTAVGDDAGGSADPDAPDDEEPFEQNSPAPRG
jgi:hypothetical protein